jgi:hypothetical protein
LKLRAAIGIVLLLASAAASIAWLRPRPPHYFIEHTAPEPSAKDAASR